MEIDIGNSKQYCYLDKFLKKGHSKIFQLILHEAGASCVKGQNQLITGNYTFKTKLFLIE